MSSYTIKDFVEKFITNPTNTINIDDDGNEDSQAKVVGKIDGEDGMPTLPVTVSKLRAIQAEKLGDTDKKYQNKKVSRKNVSFFETDHDPELSKLLYAPDSEEESDDSNNDLTDDIDEDIGDNSVEDSDEDMSENSVEESDEDNVDSDNPVEDVEESDDEVVSKKKATKKPEESKLKSFIQPIKEKVGKLLKDNSDHQLRGNAVRNQLGLYNSLFELSVLLQKVSGPTNQLPQYDKYETFLKQENEEYLSAVQNCKEISNNILSDFVGFQDDLLKQIPGTRNLVQNEAEPNGIIEGGSEVKKGKKRKLKELKTNIKDTHETLKPFKETTLTYWHDKVKQIYNQQNFNNFESSIVQQLQNALANKDKLLKRTRLIGDIRDNKRRIFGKDKPQMKSSLGEVYDPEIFDDSDFYSRNLEEALKTKSSFLGSTGDLSEEILQIKKSRKTVTDPEKKKSKHRSLNCEIRSKAQQFAGPTRINTGQHSAIDVLHKSFFGAYKN